MYIVILRHYTVVLFSMLCCLWQIGIVRCVDNPVEPITMSSEQDWAYIENGQLRVGFLKSHGGAVAYLSKTGSKQNVLNHYDHGRLVQQSYYGDEDGSLWAGKPWRFNPVQGGDYHGNPAKLLEFAATSTTAYAKTTPKHWASGESLQDCTMEQWAELDGPVLHMRFRFVYRGMLSHNKRHQETPAVFVAPELKTLAFYEGKQPWKSEGLQRKVPGWPNESVTMDEHWAAYLDDDDNGVGIMVPGVSEGTCYRYQGGSGSDCSYIAPLQTFELKPNLDFTYDAYLTLGSIDAIRERFRELHKGFDK